jgi:hypothetical protein
MKTTRLVLALVATALLLVTAGCFRTLVRPPIGKIYTGAGVPVTVDFNATDPGDRKGISKSESILGLVAWGDCGIQAAARDGGITEIRHMDAKLTNYLGVYQSYELVVTGVAE